MNILAWHGNDHLGHRRRVTDIGEELNGMCVSVLIFTFHFYLIFKKNI